MLKTATILMVIMFSPSGSETKVYTTSLPSHSCEQSREDFANLAKFVNKIDGTDYIVTTICQG